MERVVPGRYPDYPESTAVRKMLVMLGYRVGPEHIGEHASVQKPHPDIDKTILFRSIASKILSAQVDWVEKLD